MPFTAAHPAAILPLLKHSRWFSATGLIAGSIAPDFQYFILIPLLSHSGHSLEGLIYFNLPIALAVATIFHLVVRLPAVTYLPDWLKRRALAVPELNWLNFLKERWFVFAYSVLIGAATHVFWDGFTHETSYFASKWPVLTSMVNVMGYEIMLCRIIQHSSTLVGFLLILLYTWRRPTVAIPERVSLQQKFWFWAGIALAGFAFMAYALYASAFMRSAMGVVVSFLTGSMLATIVISTMARLSWLRQRS